MALTVLWPIWPSSMFGVSHSLIFFSSSAPCPENILHFMVDSRSLEKIIAQSPKSGNDLQRLRGGGEFDFPELAGGAGGGQDLAVDLHGERPFRPDAEAR